MKVSLKIIPVDLLEQYKSGFDKTIQKSFEKLHDSELSLPAGQAGIYTFSFSTSVSAVFSSKIEGEDIELDSFIKHKRFGTKYKPDYTRKIDDLYGAYSYAQQTRLSPQALENAHALLTKHILLKLQQGKLRTGNMFVVTKDGNIEYVATAPNKVKTEVKKLYDDIETLVSAKLTFEEVFFFASMLHLVFVKIHPFEDGNGRTARLLEKWFVAQKLGDKSWFIQSEKNYYAQHQTYYNNIRRLGLDYEELKYSEALPFLLMLPNSIIIKE
ncbi:MAG: Fic family protein [Bacteroidia bacterium]